MFYRDVNVSNGRLVYFDLQAENSGWLFKSPLVEGGGILWRPHYRLCSLLTFAEKVLVGYSQVEHLKTVLLSDSSSPQLLRSMSGCVEPDLAAALVHGVEEERDELRLRQAELGHALKQLEAENGELRATIGTLRDALLVAEGQPKSAEEESKVGIFVTHWLLLFDLEHKTTSRRAGLSATAEFLDCNG